MSSAAWSFIGIKLLEDVVFVGTRWWVAIVTTTTSVMSYKAKIREKRKETLQIHRHAPIHVSECTHAKDATED
jgi:hypothetical protein